jgi:hypothetical protein
MTPPGHAHVAPDFLPFECKHCHKTLCLQHRELSGHDCTVDIAAKARQRTMRALRCHISCVRAAECDPSLPALRPVHPGQGWRGPQRGGAARGTPSPPACPPTPARSPGTADMHAMMQVNAHISRGCKGGLSGGAAGRQALGSGAAETRVRRVRAGGAQGRPQEVRAGFVPQRAALRHRPLQALQHVLLPHVRRPPAAPTDSR